MPVRIVKDDADESTFSDNFNFDNPQESETNNSWSGNSNNTSNGSNALFSFLGSMAINACINYASNLLWGQRGNKNSTAQNFTHQDKISYQEADDLLQERLVSAELCVSIWAHTIFADGKMQQAEKEAVNQLIRDMVNKLFPNDIADQTIASSTLQKRLREPHNYQDVVRQASNDYAFSLNLYEQACLLIGADQLTQDSENVFLANLAQDLRIQAGDVTKARSKFNLF